MAAQFFSKNNTLLWPNERQLAVPRVVSFTVRPSSGRTWDPYTDHLANSEVKFQGEIGELRICKHAGHFGRSARETQVERGRVQVDQ